MLLSSRAAAAATAMIFLSAACASAAATAARPVSAHTRLSNTVKTSASSGTCPTQLGEYSFFECQFFNPHELTLPEGFEPVFVQAQFNDNVFSVRLASAACPLYEECVPTGPPTGPLTEPPTGPPTGPHTGLPTGSQQGPPASPPTGGPPLPRRSSISAAPPSPIQQMDTPLTLSGFMRVKIGNNKLIRGYFDAPTAGINPVVMAYASVPLADVASSGNTSCCNQTVRVSYKAKICKGDVCVKHSRKFEAKNLLCTTCAPPQFILTTGSGLGCRVCFG